MNNTPHKRLFIGIPVDAVCQQQLDAVLAPWLSRDDIRWTAAHNRHLTLAFLGATADAGLQTLRKYFTDAYTSVHPFRFELNLLARFPDTRGNILAAINSPSAELLQLYQCTRTLLDHCCISFEEREYRPHITVGRIRHPRQQEREFHQAIHIPLHVNRVVLYESVASAEGRQYVALQETVLA